MTSYRRLSCSYLGSITDAFALLDYGHYRQHCSALRKRLSGLIQVMMSVTNTVFRVCVAHNKVLNNFAETIGLSFLLTKMFFGSGSYCCSIF